MKVTTQTLLDLLAEACKSIELLSAWDKQPHAQWYYEAKQIVDNRDNVIVGPFDLYTNNN